MFSILDLSLLPLPFSLILTVAPRLLYLYSTIEKTSRLMMKSFSTVRDIRRGSQSYMEKRRGRMEIEVTRRRKGGIKRSEREIHPIISSLSVLHSLEHTKRFTELSREEKGKEKDRGNLVEKKESQKGERAIKPVITLPSKKWLLKPGFLKVQNL